MLRNAAISFTRNLDSKAKIPISYSMIKVSMYSFRVNICLSFRNNLTVFKANKSSLSDTLAECTLF